MINIEDIYIIIVLYKQRLSESLSYQNLRSNIVGINTPIKLFIHDNSPVDFIQDIINPCQDGFSIQYERDYTNQGVSAAYNKGATQAKLLQKEWVLLFDQDTTISSNYLSLLVHTINIYAEEHLFAPRLISGKLQLSPCKYRLAKGVPYRYNLKAGKHSFTHKNLLNSGLCINTNAFLTVGGYSEKVRLYYSDFVFINRFKKKYPTFVVVDENIQHTMSALSDDSEKQIGTFRLFCTGAKEAAIEQPKYTLFYTLNTLLRSCVLTVRYKTLQFPIIFYKYYLRKNA